MTSRTSLAQRMLFAISAASLLAACKTLDNKQLEADIRSDTATKGLNLASVSCPANEPLRCAASS